MSLKGFSPLGVRQLNGTCRLEAILEAAQHRLLQDGMLFQRVAVCRVEVIGLRITILAQARAMTAHIVWSVLRLFRPLHAGTKTVTAMLFLHMMTVELVRCTIQARPPPPSLVQATMLSVARKVAQRYADIVHGVHIRGEGQMSMGSASATAPHPMSV
jgi:hypothetical protein